MYGHRWKASPRRRLSRPTTGRGKCRHWHAATPPTRAGGSPFGRPSQALAWDDPGIILHPNFFQDGVRDDLERSSEAGRGAAAQEPWRWPRGLDRRGVVGLAPPGVCQGSWRSLRVWPCWCVGHLSGPPCPRRLLRLASPSTPRARPTGGSQKCSRSTKALLGWPGGRQRSPAAVVQASACSGRGSRLWRPIPTPQPLSPGTGKAKHQGFPVPPRTGHKPRSKSESKSSGSEVRAGS
jgi:hypothetical protein